MDEKQDLRRYLQRLCVLWSQSGTLKKQHFDNLVAHACNPATKGGWSLLSDMAACEPHMVPPKAILAAWQKRDLDDLITAAHILTTIGHISVHIGQDTCQRLSTELKSFVSQFSAGVSLISAAIQCITKLDSVAGGQQAQLAPVTKRFSAELLAKCEERLGAVVFSKDPAGSYDEILVARQLFTLGELTLTCPESTTKRQVLLVQALMARDVPGMQLPDESGFPLKGSHSPAVRAHAFLTLGKLCLQDEELSKTAIFTMVSELETCLDPAVRNNVVVVLTDLCVRHPNLIQPYLPNIADCLKDEAPLVRRQTVTLLTRLLKEDYIKLRGHLFFRLMSTLVDTDESVRSLGEFCATNLLLVKDASLFSANFVESLFHFNGVVDHAFFNRFPQTDRSYALFSLAGTANASKRRHIYTTMLQHIAEFDKLQLSQRLCQDILGALAESSAPISESMEAVLCDSLQILASESIKVRGRASEEEDPDAAADAKAMQAAKTKLITKVVKKNVVENIVPIVIGLKARLERLKSPMMKHLMEYLRVLFTDYKAEVNDILAADKQLSSEILFDLKKFEEEREARAAMAKSARATPIPTASAFNSPGLRGPTPQNSPLLSPSIFASAGKPGSPKFKAPQLRHQLIGGQQRPRSQRSSRLSLVQSAPGSPGTPAEGSADASPAAAPLSWVRTPPGKRGTAASKLRQEAIGNVIRLASPLAATVKAPQFNVKTGAAPQTDAGDKRPRAGGAGGPENEAGDAAEKRPAPGRRGRSLLASVNVR